MSLPRSGEQMPKLNWPTPTLTSAPNGATPAAAAADTPGRRRSRATASSKNWRRCVLDEPTGSRFDSGVEQSVRPKTEVRRSQVRQCPDEEPGADQQKQGQGGLGGHHRLTACEAESRQSGSRVVLDHRNEIETGGPDRREGAKDQTGYERQSGAECE